MGIWKKFSTWICGKKGMALMLAVVTAILAVAPAAEELTTFASQSDDAMKKGYPGLCMDGVGYSSRSIRAGGDIYEEVEGPLETGRNQALLYWAFISNRENDDLPSQNYRSFRETVNKNIRETGSDLPPITPVSVADIKRLIHQDPQVAKTYPWLEQALTRPEEYLRLGGLGGEAGVGGKTIPSPLADAGSVESAYVLFGQSGPAGYTLSLSDQEFIDSVSISFVEGGEGWSYTKGEGTITFWHTGGDDGAVAAFDLSGTGYSVPGGSLEVDSLYNDYMNWYEVTACGGDHFFQGYPNGVCPLEKHQRLYSAELPAALERIVYVKMGEDIYGETGGAKAYRHEETFVTHYTIEAEKRDYETGEPLEKALFSVLEAFPDWDQVMEEEGPGTLCRKHFSPSPAVWEGYRHCSDHVTDGNGWLTHMDTRTYEYSKSYCDGHPTPDFQTVPEEERDPETGEVTNQGAIDAAKAANARMAGEWLGTYESCQDYEMEHFGTHFHWLLDSGLPRAVRLVAESGEPCRRVSSVSVEQAFERSGCRSDCEETYEAFIQLKYSYVIREETARTGYTRHGRHRDDVPIEVITTDSSEAGGHAHFAGLYEADVEIWKEDDEKRMSVSKLETDVSEKETETELSDPVSSDSDLSVLHSPSNKDSFLPEFRHVPAVPETALVPVSTSLSWADEEIREEILATSSELVATPSETVVFVGEGRAALDTEAVKNVASARRIDFSALKPDGIQHLDLGEGAGRVSHCFQIYDHRTEGEIYFNKRDLELIQEESDQYSSYGDSQGDGTLEGAVYGLFAEEDIVHPDGNTGVVYEKGNLVAVGITDKNGDGAFLVYTEPPGTVFHYDSGGKGHTGFLGPDNLYHGGSYDDYVEDGPYEDRETTRTYEDNEGKNGNVWVGRPLILGRYSIRELSRSEGYELSVNGKVNAITNAGALLEPETPSVKGRVAVSRPLEEDVQTDGSGYGELEFSVTSQGTTGQGYDIVVSGYPEETEFFREEEGVDTVLEEVGTGVYEKYLLWEDEEKTVPKYRRASSDSSDPVYENGQIKTENRVMERRELTLFQAKEKALDEERIWEIIRGEPVGEDGICADDGKNAAPYTGSGEQKRYMKYKLEKALRSGGYGTPKMKTGEYSTEGMPVYDRGVKEGEVDTEGISGCLPGETARKTVYGSAVAQVSVPVDPDLTVGEFIRTILFYYQENPWWSYGGLDQIQEVDGAYICTIYQAVPELGEGFFTGGGSPFQVQTVFYRKGWIPEDSSKSPRWVYARYGTEPDEENFGQFVLTDLSQVAVTGITRQVATVDLMPDFIAEGNGLLVPWIEEFPVYYRKGELVLGKDGLPVQEWEYREVTELRQIERWERREVRVPAEYDRKTGEYRIHVSMGFTDSFGIAWDDQTELSLKWKAVTKQTEKRLTVSDLGKLTANWMGWQAGDLVGYGRYLLMTGAKVTVSAGNRQSVEEDEDTYVRDVCLSYEDQEMASEDGGTLKTPVLMLERPIRQRIRIRKRLISHESNTYPVEEPQILPGFRFKLYLKSNLERLYRNEQGEVCWMDRNGNAVEPETLLTKMGSQPDRAFSRKLYTKVEHRLTSKTTGGISNNVWESAVNAACRLYGYEDGVLAEELESGYTRLLETTSVTVRQPSGEERQVPVYNYEKFFQAIAAANEDQWDGKQSSLEERSDAVCQFAIDWYLDDEVKRRVQDNGHGEMEPSAGTSISQEEVYETAFEAALEKAKKYLKPFYTYDLDAMYAVSWDGMPGGGADGDDTTLEAVETDSSGFCFGISKYLPYGIYVAVEQQPGTSYADGQQLRNYHTDRPKEISIPSVCGEDGEFDQKFFYDPELSAKEQTAGYHIRFGEEGGDFSQGENQREVIYAHNRDGDFEVYPYGLEPDLLKGDDYEGYQISQSPYRPYKDIYNQENENSQYPNGTVGAYYPYGAISEDGGAADQVLTMNGGCFPKAETATVLDGIKMMTGSLTALEGQYAPALVPWSVIEPGTGSAGGLSGYAEAEYGNTLYRAKLRIEKKDRETGEMILHDGAVFSIYRASRREEDGKKETVLFYEKDTMISGSKEFLQAMGARDITPAARDSFPYLGKYWGIVPAGTPICQEEDQVFLTDEMGKRTGEFQAFSTTTEQQMPDKDTGEPQCENQNTGWLETPQPLGAGTYVLAEIKPPAGYVRSRPTAVEIYSDRIAYYQDGDRDGRTAAALFSYPDDTVVLDPEETTGLVFPANVDTARISVGNSPIHLTVEKKKTDLQETTAILDGRVDGTILELKSRYGLENLELAYNESGHYLGYGWKKGFLEEIEALRAAGQRVELIYEQGVCSGRAKLTVEVEDAKDPVRDLPGAVLTLYEGIPLKESGEREDLAYEGLRIQRGTDGSVTRMYVEKGFAGNQILFVKDRDRLAEDPEQVHLQYHEEQQENDTGEGVWVSRTIQREDTDILYYGLESLSVTQYKNGILLGYDRYGEQIALRDGESTFALKDGRPFLEIVCPDYERLSYNPWDKLFDKVPEGTKLYHLDSEGCRDSLVDPYTGMAYTEDENGRVFVWPVTIRRDTDGHIQSMDKIPTYRIATIVDSNGEEYTIGTYDSVENYLQRQLSPVLDQHGLPVYYQKSNETYEKGTPVYDRDGEFLYFRYNEALRDDDRNAYSIETHESLERLQETLYRRQGEAYLMENTWSTGDLAVNDPFLRQIGSGQADVLKRMAPGTYILEEKQAPDGYAKAMPVALTVEETNEAQITVLENVPTQVVIQKMDSPQEYKTKIIDRDGVLPAPAMEMKAKGSYSYGPVEGVTLELYPAKKVYVPGTQGEMGAFRYEKTSEVPVSWVTLDGENKPHGMTGVWTTETEPKIFEGIPAGTYILEEKNAPPGYIPASTVVEISPTEGPQTVFLRNDHTHAAFLKYMKENGVAVPMPNRFRAKMALYQAETDENGTILTDENGIPLYREEYLVDTWDTDDCQEYTAVVNTFQYERKSLLAWLQRWTGIGNDRYLSGFTWDYENLFEEYGPEFDRVVWQTERTAVRGSREDQVWRTSRGERIVAGEDEILFPEGMSEHDKTEFQNALKAKPEATTLSWLTERSASRISTTSTDGGETVTQLWETEEGNAIRITSWANLLNTGTFGRTFEYQFNYKEVDVTDKLCAVSYDSADGRHHVERLPFYGKGDGAGAYVLVETAAPEGFQPASPRAVILEETGDIQLFSMENERTSILVGKTGTDGSQIQGAILALYKASSSGKLVQDSAHLIERWESGQDGTYTEKEEELGQLPEGMKAGDLRLHRIYGVEPGTYYLVEVMPPPYYIPMLPKLLEIQENGQAVFQAENWEKTGRVEVKKLGEDGKTPLAGAEFSLTNQRTGEQWTMVTGGDGQASVSGLPVGRRGKYGMVVPDSYLLEETSPPPFHQISMKPQTFSFKDSDAVELSFQCEIRDKETEIWIAKSDFSQDVPVKGAVLAVYQAIMTENGYDADGEALETWVSNGRKHRIRGKLTAGRTYLLKELKAPAGYQIAPPMVFTVTEDGTGISQISSGREQLKVWMGKTEPSRIQSLEARGRKPLSATLFVKNLDTGAEVQRTVTGEVTEITGAEGFQEHDLCRIRETVLYSDGREETTASVTLRAAMNHDIWKIPTRRPLYTELSLSEKGKAPMAQWKPEADTGYVKRIAGQNSDGTDRFHEEFGYELREATVFSDGTRQDTDLLSFRLETHGKIAGLEMKNREPEVYVSKQDASSENELPGALLNLKGQDGTVWDRWVSETIPHRLQGKLEPGSTYVLEEEQSPDGYLKADSVIFSLSEDGLTDLVIMTDEKEPGHGGETPQEPGQVLIRKYDKETGEGLKDAEFAVYQSEGSFVAAVRTGSDGQVLWEPPEFGTYRLVETVAPEGYVLCEEPISFTVSAGGKAKENLEIPNEQETFSRCIGRILAQYHADIRGRFLNIPKLGDESDGIVLASLLGLGLFLAAAVLVGERKRK